MWGTDRPAAWAAVTIAILLVPSCKSRLMEGIDGEEAGRYASILNAVGIDAEAEPTSRGPTDRWSIEVPDSVLPRARAVLSLLRIDSVGAEKGSEKEEKGFFPEAGERERDKAKALSRDLSRILRSIPGVIDCRVHIDIPRERGGLFGIENQGPPIVKPTASVLIRHLGSGPPLSEAAVKKLLRGSMAGLDEADVSVLFIPPPRDLERLLSDPKGSAASNTDLYRVGALVFICVTLLLGVGLIVLGIHLRRLRRKS